jgi:hypothetical protein
MMILMNVIQVIVECNYIYFMKKEVKNKKCKECGEEFRPWSTTQTTCGWQCAILLSESKKKKDQKEKLKIERKKTLVLKKKLMTPSEHKMKLQTIFNKFIRLRDKGNNCISCQKPLGEKYHAGHLYSVGRFPELRFNEENVNGQCHWCNIHLHGNGVLYRINLEEKIGKERMDKLDSLAGVARNYMQHEIEEMKQKYKSLVAKKIE